MLRIIIIFKENFCQFMVNIMIKITLSTVLDEKNITQKELAKRLNVTEQNISKLKKNKYKSALMDLLDSICNELDCDISDLVKYTPDKDI